MHTFKPKFETAIRVTLIAVVLFNALLPVGVGASAVLDADPSEQVVEDVQAPDANLTVGFTSGRSAPRSGFIAQDATPEATITPIPSATSEPESTATPEATASPVTIDTATPAIVESSTDTPAATSTPSSTPPSSNAGIAPALSFEFTAAPEQAAPGDEVIFTIQITNNGKTELAGLRFSNVLPGEFRIDKSELNDLDFDQKTRTLTWPDKKGTQMQLAPGETLTLEYSVQVDAKVKEGTQIIDEAEVFVDGFSRPVTSSATLTVLPAEKRFTSLGSQGGRAEGMNGNVKIDMPAGVLNAAEGILIEDLARKYDDADQRPMLVFQLDVFAQNQVVQSSLPVVEPEITTPPNAVESEQSKDDSIPVDEAVNSAPTAEESEPGISATATSTVEPTPTAEGTPIPSLEPALSEEKDARSSLKAGTEKFKKPVEITVSFDGLVNLAELGAEYEPYLVTLDEASGVWVEMPIELVDREANTITAEVTHFSIWGAGVGAASSVTTFDNAYPDPFTGRSRFSIPIWTPPGRNGMAPALSLSYSSVTANGILGDTQAPWAGLGWNIDTVSISRQIINGSCGSFCGSGSYGYRNHFLLQFNGTGYVLIPDGTTGRYHTKSESFLYIQLHNEALGNNTPAAQNTTGEWWEVVQTDGTRWRLGWNADSEHRAAMAAYECTTGSPCTIPDGAYATLGYAGHGEYVVAARWRADRVTDTHDNTMTLSYYEEGTSVLHPGCQSLCYYDWSSYLDTISYTGTTSGTLTPAYSVVFVRGPREGDYPNTVTEWGDQRDYYQLNRIDVKYGSTVVRSYTLDYDVIWDPAQVYNTLVLASVAVSGSGTNAPPTTFTYANQYNRASCGAGCNRWSYPRLTAISNGTGATATYTLGNDGRPSTSWYNWRVTALDIDDGPNLNSPMKTTFAYLTPCYKAPSSASANPLLNWTCNGTNLGELVGYAQTTATTMDFDGATLGSTVHQFYTDEQKAGREYQTQHKNAGGTTLSQTNTTFTVATSGLPATGYFTFASRVDESLNGTVVRRNDYEYDTTTGNLTRVKEFIGISTLYRQTDYEYVTNTAFSVWILDTLSRSILKDASGVPIAEQRFGYDGSAPGSGTPAVGDRTFSQQINLAASQTINTGYTFDTYGNLTETHVYRDYGTPGSLPTGSNYLTYANSYDPQKTYVISTSGPMIPAASMDYNYGLGLPISVTDPNGNTTATVYDGLGRVTQVTYAGYGQPNIKYTYPTNPVTAPFVITKEVWDETTSTYRAVWQIMDGLGRVIQTQEPYETAGDLLLTDTAYNAMGLVKFSGLPRTLTGTGGSYFTPTWAGPYVQTNYDALGRITSVAHADASQETFGYSGLRTTTIDRNNHQKVQEVDAFGRLVKVDEYTGSGSYFLYATTAYEYDLRDLLKKVTDQQGNQTTMTYNGFGRKDSMTDPDMGYWTYGYDVFGNLTGQTDARTCVTTVTYDDLNRPMQKTYSGPGACDGTPDVSYSYDSTTGGNEGLGRRTGMTDGSGSTNWTYNVLGQPTNESRTIDGSPYQSGFTFDALSRPLTQTLPSGEVLDYDYNAMGALSGLSGTSTYLSQIHYSASGQVKDQTLGNSLLQQFCYQADTLRLASSRTYPGSVQSCVVVNPADARLNLSYDYQPNGNVSQMVDSTQNETINYAYDELDRLLNANGPYNKGYTYNSVGNLTNTMSPSVTLTAVSTGGGHACVLTSTGGIKCWGNGFYGQVGDGTNYQRTTPVDVSGLTSGAAAMATGQYSSCVVLTNGGLKCWGYNNKGQLGDGTIINRNAPVNVSGLSSGVSAVAAGYQHTCALTTAGGVKCWGDNTYGQVGDGTNTQRLTPVDVSGLGSGVTAITAGQYHTCALLSGGGVKCWGRNTNGQLGDNSTTNRNSPVNVNGLSSPMSAVLAGWNHTCALTDSGGIKCWGANASGQLGDGTYTQRTMPVDVSGLTSGTSSIATGALHSCARTTAGGVKCWGANGYGQLGDGASADRNVPADVNGLTNSVTAITAGGYNNCALTTAGAVKCWGGNDAGQLGDGTTSAAFFTPVNVSGLGSGLAAISSGNGGSNSGFSCALTTSGGVKCWGDNSVGQLGDGTNTNRITPVDVSGLTGVTITAITTGERFACALTTTGGVKCWGDGGQGQLGNNSTASSSTPVNVYGLTSGVVAISAGHWHTCALLSTGAVKCWGYNAYGQLGNNTLTNSSVPVFVYGYTDGGANATAVSTGYWHTCLITTPGTAVQCWGYNGQGQLGNNSTTNSKIPVSVSSLSGVTAITAGWHTCALINSGAVKCWGAGSDGQLGNGTTTGSTTPVAVSGITNNAAAITAGDVHTCALINTGALKCWGANGNPGMPDGRLGDGTTVNPRTIPVSVIGLNSGVIAIDAGGEHTCAVLTGGAAKCWGDNTAGQIGRDTSPVTVLFAAVSDTTYTYGDAAHKHAVTALSTGETYTYDANGNMTQRVEGGVTYTQVFDAENRLVSVTVNSEITQFVYDGDGNMVKKINPDGSRTIYVGGLYEVDKSSGGSVTRTVTYYPAAGAMRIDGTLYYNLKDHLGSASVTTDASGNIVGEQRYNPYGETRLTTGSMFTDKLFTGQREMAGLGIYHYGARFYSPKLARFISADTIVPNPLDSQAFNRYSYVLNNPMKYIDPTGHEPKYGGCYSSSGNECLNANGTSIGPGNGEPSNNGGNNGGNIVPLQENNLPPSVYDYFVSLIPFSGPALCEYVFQDQVLCNANLSSPFDQSNPNSIDLSPDYVTLQGGFPLPWISPATAFIVNGAGTVTHSNGHLYIAAGLNAGKTFSDLALFGLPASANLSGGWLIQDDKATPQQTHDFLTGLAINVSVGALVGGGATFSGGNMAAEGGLYSPQAGISATYTIFDVDLTTNGNIFDYNNWDFLP